MVDFLKIRRILAAIFLSPKVIGVDCFGSNKPGIAIYSISNRFKFDGI